MDKDINKDYSVSKEYESEEFPSVYHKFLIQGSPPQDTFVSECLQKIYESGRLSGSRLLDFGCGPTIHRVAPASIQFSDIVLSEWSEENRKEVEKWLRGDKDALDWTPSLERCARAEGFRNLDTAVEEIEKRVRKAVKKVVPCDALAKKILPDGLGEFDAICTSYCLESACFTIDVYKEALKKLTQYLKKGGALVMVVVVHSETYNVHKTLPTLYLTEEDIKAAVSEAGLELRDWFCWRDTGANEHFKYGGITVNYSIKM